MSEEVWKFMLLAYTCGSVGTISSFTIEMYVICFFFNMLLLIMAEIRLVVLCKLLISILVKLTVCITQPG